MKTSDFSAFVATGFYDGSEFRRRVLTESMVRGMRAPPYINAASFTLQTTTVISKQEQLRIQQICPSFLSSGIGRLGTLKNFQILSPLEKSDLRRHALPEHVRGLVVADFVCAEGVDYARFYAEVERLAQLAKNGKYGIFRTLGAKLTKWGNNQSCEPPLGIEEVCIGYTVYNDNDCQAESLTNMEILKPVDGSKAPDKDCNVVCFRVRLNKACDPTLLERFDASIKDELDAKIGPLCEGFLTFAYNDADTKKGTMAALALVQEGTPVESLYSVVLGLLPDVTRTVQQPRPRLMLQRFMVSRSQTL